MTPADDELDALLRSFRDGEDRLDDAARTRLDAHVRALVEGDGDAEAAGRESGATDVPSRIGPDAAAPSAAAPARRRPWLLAAAAVLVALLVGGVAIRAGSDRSDERARTAPAETPAVAPPPAELARRAAAADGPVLGDPGATYAHHVATRTVEVADVVTSGRTETWVAVDGTGRIAEVDAPDGEGVLDAPGAIQIGGLPPEVALGLPGDAEGVFAAFDRADASSDLEREDYATAIAEALATAGLPPTARSGLFRSLASLGFAPTAGVDPATGTARYEGPGAGGSTVALAIDPDDTAVASIQQTWPDGRRTSTAYSEVDLRDDLTG